MQSNLVVPNARAHKRSITPVGKMKTADTDIYNIRAVRTLIADDSPWMLKTLSQILTLEGIFTLVASATDGSQAVRYASTIKPELILMDVHMPHLNGLEATRYIKQFKDPPLVIIVTSDDTPESKALAKAAGANAFVSKSGDIHAQLKTIFRKFFGARHEPGHLKGTTVMRERET
jgi:CheY-like chemotaxis protein